MNAAARPRVGGRIWPAILFLGALALYLATLAPDVLPADSGEFQLVAAVLGVAHPPGYPLHTLLGALLARLPIGTIPWRVNLLSPLLAATTLVLVYATVRRLTGRPLAGVAAALILGTSTTFWAQATMTNVRTMAAFFTMLALYALVRHAQAITLAPDTYPARYLGLFVAALVLGLSHHLSLVFIGLCLVTFLLLVDPQLVRQPRRWPRLTVVAGLSLLPLLYLPLRAGASLAPPDLATLPGFLRHVFALGFSGDFFYFVAPAQLAARLAVLGNVLAFQFHPVVLVAGIAAMLALLARAGRRQHSLDLPLALLLLGAFALHTLISATYRAPQTVEYMLPAYALGAVILGYGLGTLPAPRFLGRQGSRLLIPFLAIVVMVFGLVQAWDHLPDYRRLAQSSDARDYATPILEGAPGGAIVLADWHWAMPLRYLQEVEHLRPDLTIEYVAPTAEPYEQTWARRIREELPSRPVIVTHYNELAYARLPVVFEPLGEAFWARTEPRQVLPAGYTEIETTFRDTLTIHGYQVTDGESSRTVTLAWSLDQEPAAPLTLFVHLVGYDGALYAQDDRVLATSSAGPGDLILTRLRLEPRPGALPGQYSVRAGVYDPEGPLLSEHGEEQAELFSLELAPSDEPLFTSRPRRQPVGGGLLLVGIDWDLTLYQPRLYLHWWARHAIGPTMLTLLDGETVRARLELPGLPAGTYQTTAHTLPSVPSQPILQAVTTTKDHRISLPPPAQQEHYVPLADGIIYRGASSYSPLQSRSGPRLHFAASYLVQRDYRVSTSLIGLNPDGTWAWRVLDDSVPAMGAIPTLKWIGGSRIMDPHALSIPTEASPGPVIGTLVVYDAFTGRVLPVLDERLAAAAPWIPLGEWAAQEPLH
jgi:4-amino-4-deoxy-L-arabinose transferase-like glycosyltransferase